MEGTQWFRKVGTRAAQAISKVVMAAVRGPEPRIAFGSVAAIALATPELTNSVATMATTAIPRRVVRLDRSPPIAARISSRA